MKNEYDGFLVNFAASNSAMTKTWDPLAHMIVLFLKGLHFPQPPKNAAPLKQAKLKKEGSRKGPLNYLLLHELRRGPFPQLPTLWPH